MKASLFFWNAELPQGCEIIPLSILASRMTKHTIKRYVWQASKYGTHTDKYKHKLDAAVAFKAFEVAAAPMPPRKTKDHWQFQGQELLEQNENSSITSGRACAFWAGDIWFAKQLIWGQYMPLEPSQFWPQAPVAFWTLYIGATSCFSTYRYQVSWSLRPKGTKLIAIWRQSWGVWQRKIWKKFEVYQQRTTIPRTISWVSEHLWTPQGGKAIQQPHQDLYLHLKGWKHPLQEKCFKVYQGISGNSLRSWLK